MSRKKIAVVVLFTIIQVSIIILFPEDKLFLGIFLFFINLVGARLLHKKYYSKETSSQGDIGTTLQIANEALPYLRHGLDEGTAEVIASIIKKIADAHAVAITDTQKVLSFIGAGCESHLPGDPIKTEATKEAIATGKHKVITSSEGLNCPVSNCKCPLGSAVIVPLKCKDKVIGALKLYSTKSGPMPPQNIRLALGIGQLLSMQAELAELERQSGLVARARLDALHAQINPHFFFNTINTIIMYSRTNSDKTRDLLVHLAEFYRQTLNRKGHFITLGEELECVETYLTLEKARFGDKITVKKYINQSLLQYPIPVFSIQPIVENAIKHGITPKVGNGLVGITAFLLHDEYLIISICDDGVGIPSDKLQHVLTPGYGSGNGVGLSNVHERLISLYGPEYGLNVCSTPNEGTCIYMKIPINVEPQELEECRLY